MSKNTQTALVRAKWSVETDQTYRLVAGTPELMELTAMHAYRRPANSTTEAEFCERYIEDLPGTAVDDKGNWFGCIGESPTVLWSSHTDTVHSVGGKQALGIYGRNLVLSGQEKVSSCLGADCTVGVWLMRQMYLAKVPGLYIWHAEEECGGNGSTYIARHSRDMLQGIQAAIAFDRKGTTSVITHQFSSRTASTAFANSLATILGGEYKPDSGGTFTDTANYEHIIPECTNISVGYTGAHTSAEQTDLHFALELKNKMLAFDASALVIARDPDAVDITDIKWKTAYYEPAGKHTLYDLVFEYPNEVADMLAGYGITVDDLLTEIDTFKAPRKSRYRY